MVEWGGCLLLMGLEMMGVKHSEGETRGLCRQCDRVHVLPRDGALHAMEALQHELAEGRLADSGATDERGRPIVDANVLHQPRGGKMFGVLIGRETGGAVVVLRAFSGQVGGAWNIPGWCPPLFDVGDWLSLEATYDPEIRGVTAELEACEQEAARSVLAQQRAALSRKLMERYHGLYTFHNFAGRRGGWSQVLDGETRVSSGMGDCCAPKLLNEAARRGLAPAALVEFYWGATNRAKTRTHKETYSPCAEKCAPLLGFMLCGIRDTP